jgi:hypothetical protein
MGSGNYTIMFDPDYMELLGVLTPTEHNAPARAFLEKSGEGIERIAFTAVDSALGAEEIRARGYTPIGPTDFERPVTMPDGTISAAKFRTFQWPTAEAPGGVRIFACQHKTRETVWIPDLMKHANGAKRLKQVVLVSPEPARDAAHLSKMIDRDARDAFGWGPRRFRVPDQGSTRQALSGSVAGGTSRARRRRACDRGRSGGGGESAGCDRRSQRRRHCRAAGCG